MRLDLVQADSDLLSATLNETLIKWICELNGLAMCQVSREIAEEEDKKAESETDKNVSEMGFELSEEAVREKYGEGWSRKKTPAPDAPPRPPVKPGTAPDGAGDPGSVNFAEMDGRDALDALVDEAIGDWRYMMVPMVEPIQQALDEALAAGETAEEFLARLPGLLEQMNSGRLLAGLVKAAMSARLGGEAGVGNG